MSSRCSEYFEVFRPLIGLIAHLNVRVTTEYYTTSLQHILAELGRVDELFRNLTVAQDSILVGDEVPS